MHSQMMLAHVLGILGSTGSPVLEMALDPIKPKEPGAVTEFDLERIRKAQEKRERKAAKRRALMQAAA